MNLIQVQDRLNKLPPLPQSIQYLTAAAQGGNPQVPPFMALARISEINKEMQSAQNQSQPPAEPLNQSLPKQALQNMGIGALGQGQPMPQQGMPQQGAPQQPPQMPPQQAPQQGAPQQVMMAADGGLMSIPVDDSMFEYGSGGIVAFANPEGNQVVEDPDKETSAEETAVEDEPGYDAEAELKKLMPQIQALMKQGVRPVRSRTDIESKLTKDYGVDTGPVGTKYLEGLASLKEAKAAERALQQADMDKREKMIVARALADWSESSRGQKGLGGLNAFTRSYTGSAEKLMGERANLREDAIKQDSLINEAKYKLQALRQAQKDGDIKAEQKADIDLAKIAKDLGVSKNNLMARLVTGNLNLMGKYETAQASRDVAATRAAAKAAAGNKPPRETDLIANQKAQAKLLRLKYPDKPEEEIQAEAFVIAKQMAGAPAVDARIRKDINEDWRKHQFTVPYLDTPKSERDAYEREWRRKWMAANPDAAPAAAPAAKAGTADNPIKIK